MTQSTLSIVHRVSQTIALLIFLAAYVHAFTGTYCTQSKNFCIQINPNGTAKISSFSIVFDTTKFSVIDSYTQTGNTFSFTLEEAADKNLFMTLVKKVASEDLERDIQLLCDVCIDNNTCLNKVYPNTAQGREFCIKDYKQLGLGTGLGYNRQEIRDLKYSKELFEKIMRMTEYEGWWSYKFILVGNSLNQFVNCKVYAILTKSGFKETVYYDEDKQFCIEDIIYNKCDGKTYNPKLAGCKDNIVFPKCGDILYGEDKQFCSGNKLKNYGKFTDPRNGNTYKTTVIGEQTWMAEDLNYGEEFSWEQAKTACPQGWHLPYDKEWQILVDFAGGYEVAGNKLKANLYSSSNEYGFSATPRNGLPGCSGCNLWWTATGWTAAKGATNSDGSPKFGSAAYRIAMYLHSGVVGRASENPKFSFSVRCVQGDPDLKDVPKQSSNDTKAPSNDAKTSIIRDTTTASSESTKNLSNVAKPSSEGIKTLTFKDIRDGKDYKFVKIGKQIWMTENLNYNANGSKCYKNNETNCKKYGRLYDWNSANKACPEGWHLPSDDEWTTLTDFIGNGAGAKLKTTSGWSENGNGTDEFGFSALPSGIVRGGNFEFMGQITYLRSSTSALLGAKGRSISDEIRTDISLNGSLLSVRCIQN